MGIENISTCDIESYKNIIIIIIQDVSQMYKNYMALHTKKKKNPSKLNKLLFYLVYIFILLQSNYKFQFVSKVSSKDENISKTEFGKFQSILENNIKKALNIKVIRHFR